MSDATLGRGPVEPKMGDTPPMHELLSQTEVLARPGWTKAAVDRFLGAPDQTKPNPMYRSGAPMRLYSGDRIKAVESTDTWRTWSTKSALRSERARAVAERRRAEVLEWVDCLHIALPPSDEEKLVKCAVAHYNLLWEERGQYEKHATVHDDREFLDRITVNYLRHEVSHYERDLDRLYGKTGADEARLRLKERVLQAIAQAFPFLAPECGHQVDRMHDMPDAWEPRRFR